MTSNIGKSMLPCGGMSKILDDTVRLIYDLNHPNPNLSIRKEYHCLYPRIPDSA